MDSCTASPGVAGVSVAPARRVDIARVVSAARDGRASRDTRRHAEQQLSESQDPSAKSPVGTRWTPEQKIYLEGSWGFEKMATLVKYLGRTESSIRDCATKELGLPLVPDGWATLPVVAKRCGVSEEEMRTILRNHGVYKHKWYSKGDIGYFEVARCEQIVASMTREWEVVTEAAGRRGISYWRLLRWLRADRAEIMPNKNVGRLGKVRPFKLRCRTVDIDRVIASRGWSISCVTVTEAARRVGMPLNTLRNRLSLAGLERKKPNGVGSFDYVDMDVVRDVLATGRGLKRPISSHGRERAVSP